MPTPLDLLLDPVMLSILGMYLLLMLWEAIFPARKLPHLRFWKMKGIGAFVLYVLLSTYVPFLYANLLPKGQFFDLSGWPVYLSATAALLLYEAGVYAWHRFIHKNNLLWRVAHQMHHSAERIDTYGAFFFSPMDMLSFTLLGTLCFSIIMGLQPQAVTILLLVTNFLAIFQHANIKTPQWLGYFIQRPESHALHHGKGVHAYNYSDLPLFDIVFGTFKNPKDFVPETGFYHGASDRIADMLLFKDVSEPEKERMISSKTIGVGSMMMLAIALPSTGFTFDPNPSSPFANATIEQSVLLPTGVKMEYVEKGSTAKTTVLFIHGYTDSWHSFEQLLKLMPETVHSIAITLRGHGGSGKPETGYSIADFATDVAAFITAKNLGPCVVVGHSMGGMVAQQLAISFPGLVKGLVLMSTDASFADNPGLPEFGQEIAALKTPVTWEFAAAFQQSTCVLPVDSAQMNLWISETMKVPLNVWKETIKGIMEADFRSSISAIQVPALILWGAHDGFCPLEGQQQFNLNIKKSRLKIFEDLGHAIHWESPEKVAVELMEFLQPWL